MTKQEIIAELFKCQQACELLLEIRHPQAVDLNGIMQAIGQIKAARTWLKKRG